MSESNQVELEWVDSIAILKLTADPTVIPVLNRERMDALSAELDALGSTEKPPKALLILGGAETGFCAGADIHVIAEITDPVAGAKIAAEGQALFQKIADLPFCTIALIHGPCVGGGFEMALACDHRIALHTLDTRIGLPEIKLGILPGFGGTYRLPRLIGLPKALEIILNGKVISAVRAKNSGMVDVLVPAVSETKSENVAALIEAGTEVATGKRKINAPTLSFAEKLITNYSLGRSIARSRAHAGIMKETKGHYPAPLRALDITINGLGLNQKKAFELEATALGELIATGESKSLVHVFFCSEASSKLGRSMREEVANKQIGVLGAGVMGAGIAAVFLSKSHPVVLLDPSEEARIRAKKSIAKYISKRRGLSEEKQKEMLNALSVTSAISDLSECVLVVEAIIEDLTIKKETLGGLAEVVSGDCIIASNTSSLKIVDIAEDISSPERVIGMHFFNPAEKMPLVEVVRGPNTDDKTLATVTAFVSSLGKYPVVVEDVPGFLVNRMLAPYIAEAGLLLSEGVSVEEIDRAATSFGMPMGPFRMLDEVGLDVAAKVQEGMTAAYGERMTAPEYPRILVEAGRLGRKSGYGFYSFHDSQAQPDNSVYELLGMRPVVNSHLSEKVIQERLIFSLLQEAIRCLDEQVAGKPGTDSAGQIDLATVMGMGFAPFRGGVLFYAETLGISCVVEKLRALEQQFGPRFAPVDGLLRRQRDEAGLFSEASSATV